MEISNFRTSSEFMVDDHDSFLYQCPMNSIFNELECASRASAAFVEDHQQYQGYSKPRVLDFKRPIESTPFEANAPLKRPKQQNNWSSCFPNQMEVVKVEEDIIWSPSSIINFPSESPSARHGFRTKPNHQGGAKLGQSREHVLAERKRREKLAQKFVNLSVLLPGLKKMDKATILEQAIKHMKELQEKVKILEDQNKNATESVVFVKKYDTTSSSTSESVSNNGSPIKLPEIDAKYCNDEVLISIHCEKRKGMLEKTLAEIENLNLLAVNSSIMSFGDSALNITVIAKKGEEFKLSMKQAVKRLHTALD